VRKIPTLGLLIPLVAFAQYDLVLKGGHLIDPKNGIDARRDIAIQGDKIAAVEPDIAAARGKKIVSVEGLYVTPGLIDIHAHTFTTTGIRGAWAGDESVVPDVLSFRTGVTTMADAGSSGWRNLKRFGISSSIGRGRASSRSSISRAWG